MKRDLVGALELPAGFQLYRGALACVRLDDVIGAVDWEQKTIKIFGRDVEVPRLTAWYGTERYTYSGIAHEPRPMPAPVAEVHALLGVGGSAPGVYFNSVLCNLYRHGGDSVSWHADDEPELGLEPIIASVSLGAARKFSIKRRADGERWDVMLRHGDVLVMSGRSQLDYLHAVPKTRFTQTISSETRVNLTFRRVLTK